MSEILLPAIAVHPGEYIAEELTARWRSQVVFGSMLSMSKTEINNIIKWRRSITPQIAARIWAAFWTSAEMRLKLQNEYDLYLIRKDLETYTEIKKRAKKIAFA